MMFTCGVCDTRAAKGFSRQAYENGVVIVRCPGCEKQHLVADRYGWFGDPGSVEDFLGDQTVVRGVATLPARGGAGLDAGAGTGEEDEEGTLEIDAVQLEAWVAKGLRGKRNTTKLGTGGEDEAGAAAGATERAAEGGGGDGK
jgi:protein import protein ZIM17